MKYVAALGVGLSIAAFGITYFVNYYHQKEIERLKAEQNDYKARLYDMQEELKNLQNPEMVADPKESSAENPEAEN